MATVVCFLWSIAVTGQPAHASDTYSLEAQESHTTQLARAWERLRAGYPREAYATFSSELLFWRGFQKQSFGYVDAERGLLVAAIFARDDDRAGAAWAQIRDAKRFDNPVAPELAGDRLVFAGRWDDAFRAYRDATQDNALRDPRPGPDRVVSAGVERALRHDFPGAIQAWSQPAVGGGPYELTDLQMALIGIACARIGDWERAEQAWLIAARTGRNVPQMDALYEGNVTALAMLYHFRAKFARGERMYRWP